MQGLEIIHRGDRNGNSWIIRIRLPSGRTITGLATENVYGGDWDLGPTWNYVVQTENPFLIDTGRFGMADRLLEMIGSSGLSAKDLKGITLTHGHEDHDGGLVDLMQRTGLPASVHPIYRCLCRSYPEQAPHPSKKNFSASCWHCFMPESFTRTHCTDYHRNRVGLGCTRTESAPFHFDPEIVTHHLPGHCPDGLAFQIDGEVLIVGDNLLPGITPHPTQEAFFQWTEKIIPAEFDRPEKVYGLRAYLASLKKLRALGRKYPGMIVLPAHRLFHDGDWRNFDLAQRSAEIIDHHVQRCGSIVAQLKGGPRTVEEIVLGHFEPKLLKGFGFKMAESEVKSHLELLNFCGDVEWSGKGAVMPTGTIRFDRFIHEMTDAQ